MYSVNNYDDFHQLIYEEVYESVNAIDIAYGWMNWDSNNYCVIDNDNFGPELQDFMVNLIIKNVFESYGDEYEFIENRIHSENSEELDVNEEENEDTEEEETSSDTKKDDCIICISKSGNTPEIKVLVPLLKSGKNKLISIVGNLDSYLAKQSDYILNTTVEKEACPNNLAPTSSTTAQLAMGDALAVCLLECKKFTEKDFAKFHPGGALGKKLYLKVSDISEQNQKPVVKPSDSIQKVILEISSKRLGAVAVVETGKLKGIITDGDLRRMLEKAGLQKNTVASSIMNKAPKTIDSKEFAVDAIKVMKQYNISQLVVTDKGRYVGFVHLHDLLREGIL